MSFSLRRKVIIPPTILYLRKKKRFQDVIAASRKVTDGKISVREITGAGGHISGAYPDFVCPLCLFIPLCVKLSEASPPSSFLPADLAGQLFPAVQAILTLNQDLSSAPAPLGWAGPTSEARDVESGGKPILFFSFFFLNHSSYSANPQLLISTYKEARETPWNLVKSLTA